MESRSITSIRPFDAVEDGESLISLLSTPVLTDSSLKLVKPAVVKKINSASIKRIVFEFSAHGKLFIGGGFNLIKKDDLVKNCFLVLVSRIIVLQSEKNNLFL